MNAKVTPTKDYKTMYVNLKKAVNRFLKVNTDFENFAVDHMMSLADEQTEEYNELVEKQEIAFDKLIAALGK